MLNKDRINKEFNTNSIFSTKKLKVSLSSVILGMTFAFGFTSGKADLMSYAAEGTGNTVESSSATDDTSSKMATFKRVAGSNRVMTSIEISNLLYPKGSKTVVLANAQLFPDVLSAVPYANAIDAPILYTNQENLPDETMHEIQRLNCTDIVIIGGKNSVSQSQMATLQGYFYNVKRISGFDRFQTSDLIAKEMINNGYSEKASVIIANGENFPDALSITTLANKQNIPILLTKRNNLSEYALERIKHLPISKLYVVGGTSAISEDVVNKIRNIKPDLQVQRYAGIDRYATSAVVADSIYPKAENVVIASGEQFADALVGSQLEIRNNAPILLVKRGSVPKEVGDYLKASGVKNNFIIGGVNTIKEMVINQLDHIEK